MEPDTAAAAADSTSSKASTRGAAVLVLLAVVIGAGPCQGQTREPARPPAFAAGAVIASLADPLMPEANEHGCPAVAMSTAAGFVLPFVLSLA